MRAAVSKVTEYDSMCNLLLAIIERAVLDDDEEFLLFECAPDVGKNFRSVKYVHSRFPKQHGKQIKETVCVE